MANATKSDVQQIVNTAVNKAVDDLSEIIGSMAQTMHVELAGTKEELSEVKVSINKLVNNVDGFC